MAIRKPTSGEYATASGQIGLRHSEGSRELKRASNSALKVSANEQKRALAATAGIGIAAAL
jgi:hypothetical protein